MLSTTMAVLLAMLAQQDPAAQPAPQAEDKKSEAPAEDTLDLSLHEMLMYGQDGAQPTTITSIGGSTLKFYGFLRLDLIYDTARPNSIQTPRRIISDSSDPNSDITIHPKLTRFGIDFEGPTVEALGNAKLTGKLEVDFYNATASNSREAFRMRHGYLKLAWETFSVLAGQREDIASPLFPTPNNDMVMWGAGNLGDRRPQIRGEYKASGLTVTFGIGETGAVDNNDADGNGFLDGQASGIPTVQGRVAYAFNAFVEKKQVEIGAWFHFAREKVETPTEDDFSSTGFGIDVVAPVHEKVWIKLEFWSGENLDDLRGGIDNAGVQAGNELEATGFWVEVGFQATPEWEVVVGGSMDDPDDSDLAGTAADRNLLFWVANRLKFGKLTLGIDLIHWTTEYVSSALDDGVDERFTLFAQYSF